MGQGHSTLSLSLSLPLSLALSLAAGKLLEKETHEVIRFVREHGFPLPVVGSAGVAGRGGGQAEW